MKFSKDRGREDDINQSSFNLYHNLYIILSHTSSELKYIIIRKNEN